MPESRTSPNRADWIQPAHEQHGVTLFMKTVRERAWMIVASVILLTGIAVAYVVTTEKVYEAEADMLVVPVPLDNPTLANLGLITESSDPTLSVLTAAQLITTNEVAERVRENLGLETSSASLLGDVNAEPVGQSNIVAVIAEQPTAEEAATLATAFGEAAEQERTAELRRRIDTTLEDLTLRLEGLGDADAVERETLSAQIGQLETLRASGDPTITLETPAEVPDAAAWPRPTLTVALGALAGLVLGVLVAFGVQALDPRLRREEQLRALYRVPILTRVPGQPGRRKTPLTWSTMSPPAIEAYRTLRATLTTARHDEQQPTSILVTGSSPSEGKTTTAVSLAISLAVSGARVILIEADLRRPTIASALGVRTTKGITDVLLGRSTLGSALRTTSDYGPNLQLLLADDSGPETVELFSLPSGERLIEQAQKLADYVIVDSPPLTDVIDALPLALRVDEVLVVVRLGKSRLAKIKQLGEVLSENDIRPAGIAVVGVRRPSGDKQGYYYYPQQQKPGWRPWRRRADQQTGYAGPTSAPQPPQPPPPVAPPVPPPKPRSEAPTQSTPEAPTDPSSSDLENSNDSPDQVDDDERDVAARPGPR